MCITRRPRGLGITLGLRTHYSFSVLCCDKLPGRFFREQHGWTGLLMDGGFENKAINLQKQFLSAENIVHLFRQNNVSKELDLLSVDTDLNTFWILREILAGGFQPRVIIAEVNIDFLPGQAYAVVYLPHGMWTDPYNCYYGASPEAFAQLGEAFGYTPVYLLAGGANLILVRTSILDQPLHLTVRNVSRAIDYAIDRHTDCDGMPWVHVRAQDLRSHKHYRVALLAHARRSGAAAAAALSLAAPASSAGGPHIASASASGSSSSSAHAGSSSAQVGVVPSDGDGFLNPPAADVARVYSALVRHGAFGGLWPAIRSKRVRRGFHELASPMSMSVAIPYRTHA